MSLSSLSFNLVLEWLLVSGPDRELDMWLFTNVSISFSSGFWFQGQPAVRLLPLVHPFQSRSRVAFGFRPDLLGGASTTPVDKFQSRSRVAFGFRLTKIHKVSSPRGFNLVLEWLLVSGV